MIEFNLNYLGMKVLVMMIGEFEFDQYFTWKAVKEEYAYVSAQILFVSFIFFGSIVIANLLVSIMIPLVIGSKSKKVLAGTQTPSTLKKKECI